ncbi:MAG: PIN domain-containing protein [Candidatus Diapherotrites archaeon]
MEEPLRVMLDTNIYGFIAKEENPEEFLESIATSKVMVCGSKVVRNELRKIPLKGNKGSRKLRSDVLRFYNILVKDKRNYEVNKLIKGLAQEYEKAYRRKSKDLENDFLIVATASLHHVKIVCSNDEKTMKSPSALKAYAEVNSKFQLPKPEFISLAKFKGLIK